MTSGAVPSSRSPASRTMTPPSWLMARRGCAERTSETSASVVAVVTAGVAAAAEGSLADASAFPSPGESAEQETRNRDAAASAPTDERLMNMRVIKC